MGNGDRLRILKLEEHVYKQHAIQEKNVTMEKFLHGIYWIVVALLTSAATYWIYQVMQTYGEEAIFTTRNIVRNTTFSWPTITIEGRRCYNTTALEELKKKHNFTLIDVDSW